MTQPGQKTAPKWFVTMFMVAIVVVPLALVFELIRGARWLFSSAPTTPAPSDTVAAKTLQPPPAPRVPGETEAWVMAKGFVTNALKSPGTADFGGILENHQDPSCVVVGEAWKCVGWVDAQNGFGATLRNNFAVTIKWVSPGEWADPQSWIVVAGPTVSAR